MQQESKLKEVAALFFKLGCIAFGGPASHIAMVEDEVVTKRKWMTQEHFLDLVGATNLIPGPNSTEIVMHCGHERAGWKGLIVAGLCFIFPAVVITSILAGLYQEYGQLPDVEPFIYGIKPAVISIIAVAAFRLGKKALKSTLLGVLGAITLTASLLGINEILALFGCAVLGLLLHLFSNTRKSANIFTPFFLLPFIGQVQVGNLKIFLAFLKVGAILYGSGYVLFAFLDAELVVKGWITRQVLIDAVAVGQFTPGPILSTATFVGWQLNGATGALMATVGIFLPSFLLVYALNPLIPKMRKSKAFSAFLDAANVAAVALIISICVEMGLEALAGWRSMVIAILSILFLLFVKRANNFFIVLGGALFGYLLTLVPFT
ncbi:chromate efflux transporter [Flagellimonas sp.]|uniref:chromate efflux transporter n=1 Tax=Flagellimonas sp. TaxID=2058762 RepID=UPI003B58B904